jgi:hypothetical protein
MKPLIGAGGILAIQGVAQVPPVSNGVEIVKLVIQAVLGLASLYHMFKKPKTNKNQ